MKKSLTLLLFLLFSTILIAQNYSITASSLRVRNQASTKGNPIGSLKKGQIVYVEEISDGWAKITYKGKKAYISAEYIQLQTYTSSTNQNSKPKNPSVTVIMIAIVLTILIGMYVPSETINYLSVFVLPILLIILHKNIDPHLTFCKPSRVGWWQAIFAFMGFIAIISLIWARIKSSVKGEYRYFSNEFVSFIASTILFLLYLYTMYLIIMDTLVEITPMILLAILSLTGGGDRYIGSFTDRQGRDWNVYEK